MNETAPRPNEPASAPPRLARLDDLRIDRGDERPRRRVWTWVIAAVALLLVVAIAVPLLAPRAPQVKVATAAEVAANPGGTTTVLNASGYVTARRQATVSSKVTGKVTEVLVEEGTQVAEGQLVARIDAAIPDAARRLGQSQVAAAAAAREETRVRIAQAKLDLQRQEELAKAGFTAQAEVDRASHELRALQARLATQQEELQVAQRSLALRQQDVTDTEIRAPFAGVVTSKNAQPGEMISPMSAGGGFTRTGICTLVDMGSLELEVDVNEAYINRVRPGQPAEGVLDAYPDWRIPAHVITIVPTADRQKATVMVRIAIDVRDPRILPDMGVKVSFVEPRREGAPAAREVTVPKAALRRDGDADVVLVVTAEGRLERRAVQVADTTGDQVKLAAGLGAGERVVIEGPATLKDGDRVRVASGRPGRGKQAMNHASSSASSSISSSSVLANLLGVEKHFRRGAEEVRVLRGLDLELKRGEFLALMGPSGSGKSTLLNLLAGLDRPDAGSVEIDGQRIDRLSDRQLARWRARHVGLVFQFYNLLPVLSAAKNIELPLLLAPLSAAQRRQHVQTALAVVGLEHRAKHLPRQLSGGEQQRVGIARAIVTDATLILADEPTGDLDRKTGDGILDLLQGLNKQHGKTIVMVTHDPHAAARAGRILHMVDGQVSTEMAA